MCRLNPILTSILITHKALYLHMYTRYKNSLIKALAVPALCNIWITDAVVKGLQGISADRSLSQNLIMKLVIDILRSHNGFGSGTAFNPLHESKKNIMLAI